MTESCGSEARFSLRTAWVQYRQTPLRGFLRTETGGAAVLLAATLAWLLGGGRLPADPLVDAPAQQVGAEVVPPQHVRAQGRLAGGLL